MAKKRTDAERRVRQTDRLARVLRVLQLIQSPGPCTAQSIAKELECSERTVYRDLQTLASAGVPWFYDEFIQSYRVRDGYKGFMPGLQGKHKAVPSTEVTGEDARSIATLAKEAAQRLLTEAEGVVQALDRLSKAIDGITDPGRAETGKNGNPSG